jgi:hypothetical protein
VGAVDQGAVVALDHRDDAPANAQYFGRHGVKELALDPSSEKPPSRHLPRLACLKLHASVCGRLRADSAGERLRLPEAAFLPGRDGEGRRAYRPDRL